MKAMKWITLSVVAAAVACTSLITACGPTEEEPEVTEYTVTYYDGTTVLDTQTVEEGEKATEWTPTKDGYSFDGWYATPNFAHEFDFNTAITEDTSVFSKWSSTAQVDDTRTFYICGQGSSSVLGGSAVLEDGAQMTKTEGKNEYTLTVDLYEGDWFQFVTNTAWDYQRGWGYMTTGTIDGVEYFASNGSIDGTKPTKMEDIVCKKDGNYTFTLTTHPADDLGKPTELSNSDTITFTYNGEPEGTIEAVTHYWLKGAQITAWHDMYNDATELKETETKGVYSMSVYLKEGDQFMFASTFVTGTESEVGNLYIKADTLDEASKAYVDGDTGNMTAKASGMYTFTYNEATTTLSVTFDGAKTPVESDYYLDGAFGGDHNWTNNNFNPDYQLVETAEGSGVYVIENVELAADTEFTIQAFVAGSTEPGDSWENQTGNYNYRYFYGNANAFTSANPGAGNYNFKVLIASTYTITFDSYSKIVTIEDMALGYDIYINGNMQGASWPVSFDAQYKFTQSETDENIYELTFTFDDEYEFGFKAYPAGTTDPASNSDWLGLAKMGTEGTANNLFKGTSASNFMSTVPGTYRIVYNAETDTVDFYAVD